MGCRTLARWKLLRNAHDSRRFSLDCHLYVIVCLCGSAESIDICSQPQSRERLAANRVDTSNKKRPTGHGLEVYQRVLARLTPTLRLMLGAASSLEL
eukprot:6180044-Pleurochrysis_carterae.AAC.3